MPVFQLTDRIVFPPPTLAEENGLLAVGGDLSPQRLLAAYRLGIFPWFSKGDPLLWWYPSPRLVLFPEALQISKRLARYCRTTNLTLSINKACADVIARCANTRTDQYQDTWITTEMADAYTNLHRLRYCHSVECWQQDALVGGLYGIALGRIFFGESMFSLVPNASTFCLIHLVAFLKKNGYRLIDCQMTTPHLVRLGAREISGDAFQKLLHRSIPTTAPNENWPHGQDNRNGIV